MKKYYISGEKEFYNNKNEINMWHKHLMLRFTLIDLFKEFLMFSFFALVLSFFSAKYFDMNIFQMFLRLCFIAILLFVPSIYFAIRIDFKNKKG